jgi:hypothetical protein
MGRAVDQLDLLMTGTEHIYGSLYGVFKISTYIQCLILMLLENVVGEEWSVLGALPRGVR